jgi:hypothetical protein
VRFLEIAEYVRPEAHGAPDFLVERAIRESAIDFCVKTDIYRLEPEDFLVIPSITEYELSIPVGTELNHIVDIYRNKQTLQPVSYTRLLEITGDGSSKGKPNYYSQRDNTQFYLALTPNERETLKALYSLKPSPSSSSIPDTIGEEYKEPLVHGAIYRLQMMTSQPWSNMGAAQSNKALFDQRTGQVTREVKYGYSGGSLTVKSRAFI